MTIIKNLQINSGWSPSDMNIIMFAAYGYRSSNHTGSVVTGLIQGLLDWNWTGLSWTGIGCTGTNKFNQATKM